MPDREKVIEALEACVLKDPDDSRDCRHCPRCNYGAFITTSCINGVMADALALLKAQEPRVMTPEEYEAWIDLPFTERNPVFHEERTKRGTVTSWVNTAVCTLREYGKNDRCWTSRPTDEQREAVPWN